MCSYLSLTPGGEEESTASACDGRPSGRIPHLVVSIDPSPGPDRNSSLDLGRRRGAPSDHTAEVANRLGRSADGWAGRHWLTDLTAPRAASNGCYRPRDARCRSTHIGSSHDVIQRTMVEGMYHIARDRCFNGRMSPEIIEFVSHKASAYKSKIFNILRLVVPYNHLVSALYLVSSPCEPAKFVYYDGSRRRDNPLVPTSVLRKARPVPFIHFSE